MKQEKSSLATTNTKIMKNIFCLILLMVPITLMAQKTVKGIVLDEANIPLPGASILVKGTTKGEVTNIDGEFTITLDSTPATLVISYLGYVKKELTITNQNSVTVVLDPDQQKLDEVVLIGYGTVNKKDLTGSVASVKPNQTGLVGTKGIEGYLQGRVAGVQVSALGSEPGAPTSIKIRGTGTISTSSQPLYVIDGVIVDSANEETLNPLSGGNNQSKRYRILRSFKRCFCNCNLWFKSIKWCNSHHH